jgi:benzoate-CoA ligase family protein
MSHPTFPDDFNLADYFLFHRLGEGLAHAPAILFGDRVYSYGDVATRVRSLVGYFALNENVHPEERVLICLHDSPAFAVAFFATLAHGAVVAMANPDAPIEDLRYLVDYTRARCVITNPRVAAALVDKLDTTRNEYRHVVVVPEVATGDDVEAPVDVTALEAQRVAAVSFAGALETGAKVARAGGVAPPRTKRDDVAVWLFTSGSTGKSKAAIHTHRDFAFNCEVYAKKTVGYRKGDVTVSVSRLFFGYATGTNLMFPFAVGATTALFAERPTPESLSHAIERHRPTIVTNVPTMMGKLLEHDDARRAAGEAPLDFSSVRFHLSAGEALPASLLGRFAERFPTNDVYDGIGSAEMFHIYCSNRPGDVKPGSLGKVVEGYELKILAEEAAGPGAPELARGETGVMWVKGDSVALGYHRDRDKSWSTFHGHWCRTGDLFKLDDEGYLWFSGRVDDLLKVGGVWVAPIEIEECLLQHGAVSHVAVIGADEEGLTKPKALVVLREEARAKLTSDDARRALADELKSHVKERLTKHKYPRWIAFVDDVPRNDRAKVDRKTLRELELQGKNPKGH